MSYTDTVNIIFYTAASVAAVLFTHYAILAAVGVFTCKKIQTQTTNLNTD